MRISILRLARNDLKEITEYLQKIGVNQPKKFRESFKNFCVQAVKTPRMFAQHEHNAKYRKAVFIYGYLGFYQTDENSGTVRIYRVLHGKRDAETSLTKEPDSNA